MSNIVNIPPCKVWVRKEYLTDHQSGHGEFVEGYWVTAKSLPGRTFYFETYLPTYAAMYDKLPISAFVSEPETPTPDLPLDELQFWNCMDYGVTAIEKQFIGSMGFQARTKRHGMIGGKYLFTLDNLHENYDVSLSPKDVKIPDFKVSTEYYEVENPFSDWGTLGDSEEYFWKTENESD
jgi:hypothetical protein